MSASLIVPAIACYMDTETILNKSPKPRKRSNKASADLEPSKGRKSRKLDPIKALQLTNRGYGPSDIGDKYGVSSSAVCNALARVRKLMLTPEELKEYREKEVPLLDSVKARLLVACSEEDRIKKASTLQLTTAFCQLADKSLLFQGKATANIDIRSMAMHFSTMRDDLERQIAEMTSAQDVVVDPDPSAA